MEHERTDKLAQRARQGDHSAFAELVGLTGSFAFASVYRMTGHAEDSRDIVQDAYIRVWANIGRYKGTVPFRAWFFSILRNLSLDWLRREKVRRDAVISGMPAADHRTPGTQLENEELAAIIRVWMLALPETQQLVFMLRDMEDLPIREVQEQTGLSESSIKSNLYIARKKLAAHLKRKGYSIP
jgi:RNA polymerase sigma-70 factor (ECF subfamily)